ncbi:hypothetical protein AAHB94_02520 [Bacillus toyonensis]
MKSKLIIVLCLIGIIIPSSKALANGEIITRKEVRNYYYIVDKENNNYTWRIGYKTSNSIIKENELNLEDFRNAVNKLSQQNLELYVSIAYLIILLLILLISFIKRIMILQNVF